MNEALIQTLLKNGEGRQVEFKTCRDALNRDVYETVCAFLNRSGGDLLLGVTDNGQVTGVNPATVEQLKKDFVSPQKINPSFYLNIEELLEADIFRFVLPLADTIEVKETPEQVTEQVTKLLEFCLNPRSRGELKNFLNLKHREHFRSEILNPLLERGLLKSTIPDKPTSPKQKYYTALRGDDKP